MSNNETKGKPAPEGMDVDYILVQNPDNPKDAKRLFPQMRHFVRKQDRPVESKAGNQETEDRKPPVIDMAYPVETRKTHG